MSEPFIPTPPPQGIPELDELQRGQEETLTVETLEQAPVAYAHGQREIQIPDPGERPGAVRITDAEPASTEGGGPSER